MSARKVVFELTGVEMDDGGEHFDDCVWQAEFRLTGFSIDDERGKDDAWHAGGALERMVRESISGVNLSAGYEIGYVQVPLTGSRA